jgi:hypothetical protein
MKPVKTFNLVEAHKNELNKAAKSSPKGSLNQTIEGVDLLHDD